MKGLLLWIRSLNLPGLIQVSPNLQETCWKWIKISAERLCGQMDGSKV